MGFGFGVGGESGGSGGGGPGTSGYSGWSGWSGNAFSTAPVVLTYAATLTPDCNDGLYRKCAMTGDATLIAPGNGTEGMRWECWFTATGLDCNLTFDAAILIPSASTFISPQLIPSGKLYQVLLKYNGTAWMLTSLVGGY